MYVCCSSDVELEAAEVNGRLQNKCKCIMTSLVTGATTRAMRLKGQINRGNEVAMVTLQVTVTACMDAILSCLQYSVVLEGMGGRRESQINARKMWL